VVPRKPDRRKPPPERGTDGGWVRWIEQPLGDGNSIRGHPSRHVVGLAPVPTRRHESSMYRLPSQGVTKLTGGWGAPWSSDTPRRDPA
jgi:hypothetical protein